MEEIDTSSTKKRGFLIKVRKKRKLTQKQVAEYLNIHTSTYANIERGDRNPSLEIALLLSDFFGVDIRLLKR
ncbi:helix-turn-helix transcriptional regulator [Niallia sp. 03190]|uniref:helix-turn-helix transcriptional regulator n=1 Tax=Niallia sp. 03190 TaxID=3458061 RepID=UPI00404439FF